MVGSGLADHHYEYRTKGEKSSRNPALLMECPMESHLYQAQTEALGLRSISSVSALVIDRLADIELQHGHHERAEQLSRLAADLRESP